MSNKRVHRVCRIISAAAAGVAGILLILGCIAVNRSGGESPFSADSVSAVFRYIAIPIYLCLAIFLGGFILSFLVPEEQEKKPAEKQYAVILEKLHSKLDWEKCPESMQIAIRNEQKLRKILRWVCFGVLALFSMLFLAYGLNIRNFPKGEATEAVKQSMWLFIPCLVIPFGFAVYSAYQQRRSIIREINVVKIALQNASRPAEPTETAVSGKKLVPFIRYGILAVAIFLIVFGFMNLGYEEVLGKAVAICRECVGLG